MPNSLKYITRIIFFVVANMYNLYIMIISLYNVTDYTKGINYCVNKKHFPFLTQKS